MKRIDVETVDQLRAYAVEQALANPPRHCYALRLDVYRLARERNLGHPAGVDALRRATRLRLTR